MKKILLLILIMGLSFGCRGSQKRAGDLDAMSQKFDSLIMEGLFHMDSVKLEQAISLSDSILGENISDEKKRHIFNSRAMAFAQLRNVSEALKAKEREMMLLPSNNVEGLQFLALKCQHLHKLDSMEYYSNLALKNCNDILEDEYNTNVVLKKTEILFLKYGEKTAKHYLITEHKKHPEDEMLKFAIRQWSKYRRAMSISPFSITEDNIDQIRQSFN